DEIYAAFTAVKAEFDQPLLLPEAAISRARSVTGPVVLADVQDNPGAGGTSDTTGLLQALIDAEVPSAVLGVICDPDIADMAHAAGMGATIQGALGGKIDPSLGPSLDGAFVVRGLSDGKIVYTGEMYGGGVADVGPSCLLSVDGTAGDIRIVVSSVRTQCLDRAFFTHFGIDLSAEDIICVKSTVHYRADFDPISRLTLNVASPGLLQCDLARVPYKHALRAP
ncbi:MAG: MlrC C-terminal domain-containing protein, partial [Pseudomonadota bacterium]